MLTCTTNKLKDYNRLEITCKTTLKTSLGPMNVRSNMKPTKDAAPEIKEKHPSHEYVCDLCVHFINISHEVTQKCFIISSRVKYPIKVHVWAGISKRGPTEIYIFKGSVDASLCTEILWKTLLPFILAAVGLTVIGLAVIGLADVSLADVSLAVAVIGLAVVGLAVIGLADVGLAVIGLANVGLAVIGLADVSLAVIGLAVIGLAFIGLTDVTLADVVGLAVIGLVVIGLAVIGLANVGLADVGLADVGLAVIGLADVSLLG